MTCRDFTDFLTEYLDGDLSAPERARFEEHLGECPDCVAYLTTYQETIKIGKAVYAAEDAGVPLDVPEELIRAILTARGGTAQVGETRPR